MPRYVAVPFAPCAMFTEISGIRAILSGGNLPTIMSKTTERLVELGMDSALHVMLFPDNPV